MRSFRLFPLTMFMAFLLLGLKVGEVMRDGRMLALSFAEARAEGETKDAKPAEKEAGSEPKVNPPTTDNDDTENEEPPKHEYSQVEIDLLESLAKRRAELDDWAKQVQLKENMLIATEQRINGKIDSLQKVKKQVEDLLAQYNAQEDTKIKSLVKIYENMKPKDAARIFEELDMPVLLMVVDRMAERKVAPVLAAMNPTKAKDVTVQLAEQRKLQKNRASTTPPLSSPSPDASALPDSSGQPPAASPLSGSPPAADAGATTSGASSAPAANSPPAASAANASAPASPAPATR